MRHIVALQAVAGLLIGSVAAAQDPAPSPTSPADRAGPSEAQPKEAAPKPPQAVSAFQLRGTSPSTQLRLDTTVAPYTVPSNRIGYLESVSLFSASVKVASTFAIQSRIGAVRSDPVSTGHSVSGV